jgi:hypothetical protein
MAEQFIQKPGGEVTTLSSSGFASLQDAANQGYAPVAAPKIETTTTTTPTAPVAPKTVEPPKLAEPKTTVQQPGQVFNKEEIGQNITQTLQTVEVLEKKANQAFLDAAARYSEGRNATAEEIGSGLTVRQAVEKFGIQDLAPSMGLTTPTAPKASAKTTFTPKSALEQQKSIVTSLSTRAKEIRKTAEEDLGVSKIQEKLNSANEKLGQAQATVEKMQTDLELQDILSQEAQIALKDKIEGRNIPMEFINSQLTKGLNELSQAQRIDRLYDVYALNTQINSYNADVRYAQLLQGQYEQAQDNVQETIGDWKEEQMLMLDILEQEGQLEKEARADAENEIAYKEQLGLDGYVEITPEVRDQLVQDLGISATTYGQYFFERANGDLYLKPSEQAQELTELERLNIESKKIDIAKKLQDLSDFDNISSDVLNQIDKISTSFDNSPIVKNFNEVQNKKLSVKKIVEDGVGGPADLALVFEFMKALDPTSVVRESEYDSAAKSGNIFSGWAAKFNGYLKEEGGFLPEGVKNEFKRLVDDKFDVIQSQYGNLRSEKARLIDRKTGRSDGSEYLINYDFTRESPEEQFSNYYFSLPDEEANEIDALQEQLDISDADMWEYIQEKQGFNNVGSDTDIAPLSVNSVDLGSRLARVNNNPGNLRLAGQPGATEGEGGFARFPTPEAGVRALANDLKAKITGNSPAIRSKLGRDARTLREVISVFAPKEDNNDPNSYANFVAKELGVSPDEPVSNLINRLDELTKAFVKKESSSSFV